ncbi:MAG TPA: hypothetical protein VGQ17_06165 [Gemmatimonadales bacterium]|nr:hypothetical protein [Gemmatimonadales bacterium]
MSLKTTFGLDGFDLAIQAGVTAIVGFWIAATNRTEDAIIGCSMASTASLVVLAIRRRFALRRAESIGLSSGEMAAERLAELERRVAELEFQEVRMVELEERLDFAERLLAAGGESSKQLPRFATGGESAKELPR